MKKVKYIKIWFIHIGYNKDLWGICLFDKYSWNSIKGFEILKTPKTGL